MRRKSLAVAGLALVLTLAACGKAPESAPQLQTAPVNDSASLFKDPNALVAAAKAGTAKSKSVDFDATVTVGSISMTSTGQEKLDGANTSMAMTMDMVGQQMEMRLLSGSVYLKLPAAAMKQMGVTKPWAKFSLSDLGALGQAMGGGGDINKLAEQNDPSTTLAQIQQSGKIVSSDKTQLDGQPTNHYVLDLDVAKLLDKLPAGFPDSAKSLLAGKNIHMPAELWLNNDQLPVEIKMDMTPMMQAMAPSGEAAKTLGSMKMDMKYTNWGSTVVIEAPPADQVQTGVKLPGVAGAPTTKKHI